MNAGLDGDTIEFRVYVRPGGRHDQVEGVYDGMLAIRVTAAPAGGKANASVATVIAAAFDVAKRDVAIVSGRTAQRKRVRISGDSQQFAARLDELRTER